MSAIDWGVESLVAVVCVSSPVSQFRVLQNARDSSHKVIRRFWLTLYCALGARWVDLLWYEADTWRAKCERREGRSSTELESAVSQPWPSVPGLGISN
jgi:hypothetical protein